VYLSRGDNDHYHHPSHDDDSDHSSDHYNGSSSDHNAPYRTADDITAPDCCSSLGLFSDDK
jgi:hypothetical protein